MHDHIGEQAARIRAGKKDQDQKWRIATMGDLISQMSVALFLERVGLPSVAGSGTGEGNALFGTVVQRCTSMKEVPSAVLAVAEAVREYAESVGGTRIITLTPCTVMPIAAAAPGDAATGFAPGDPPQGFDVFWDGLIDTPSGFRSPESDPCPRPAGWIAEGDPIPDLKTA